MKITRSHLSTLRHLSSKGFTLVELMVNIAISGFIVAAIYSAYISQQRTALAQEQVAEMQQNIRAGLDIMENEIRLAGLNPQQVTTPVISIMAATATSIRFGMDLDEDGDILDTGEDVSYSLYISDGISKLGRNDNTGGLGNQAVAENIDALEFYYTLKNGTQILNPTAVQLEDIRTVQISILARAGRADQDFTNTMVYCPASNPFNPATGLCTNAAPATIWGAYNDNFRRRLLTTTIQCRNMGL
jgi:type IV pilus assembly protein PilW